MGQVIRAQSPSVATLKTVHAQVKDKVTTANKIGGALRTVATFADAIEPLSARTKQGIQQTKWIGVAKGICDAPDIYGHIKDAITNKEPKKKAKSVAKAVVASGSVAGAAGEFALGLKRVKAVSAPSVAWTAPLGLAVLPIAALGSAVPTLYTNIKDLATKEKPAEKAVAAGNATVATGELLEASGEFAKGLQTVGAVGAKAVAWTGPLGIALLPFQAIGVGLEVYTLHKVRGDKQELDSLRVTPKHESEEVRATHMASALSKLCASKSKEIDERFEVDKEEKLKEKTERLMQDVCSKNKEQRAQAVEKGEKLIKELKGKVSRKLALQVVTTALKIVGLVAAIAALFIPPVSVALLGIAAVSAVIGLGVFLYKRYMMSKKVQALGSVSIAPTEVQAE